MNLQTHNKGVVVLAPPIHKNAPVQGRDQYLFDAIFKKYQIIKSVWKR
jgi:hypothetical protein